MTIIIIIVAIVAAVVFLLLWLVADGLSLKFEWQQVSSSLEDSSQYSGWYQKCCGLDDLHSPSYFQVLQSFW